MNYRLDSVVEQLQAFLQNGFNGEDDGQSPFFIFRVTKQEIQTKMLPPPASGLIKEMYMKLAKMTAHDVETELVGVAFEAYYKTADNPSQIQQMVDDGLQDSPDECMMLMMQSRTNDFYAGMAVIEEVEGVNKIVKWNDFNDAEVGGSMNINFFS